MAHDRMLDVLDPVYVFGPRVANPDVVVEFGLEREIDEFVDGDADDRAAVLTIIAFDIAAASGKADPARCFADDHESLFRNPSGRHWRICHFQVDDGVNHGGMRNFYQAIVANPM